MLKGIYRTCGMSLAKDGTKGLTIKQAKADKNKHFGITLDCYDKAEEIENDGTQQMELPENPYLFDNITNDEEAIAFIEAYNKKNGIKGQVPKKHETILNRLLVIYSEQKQAAGNVDE